MAKIRAVPFTEALRHEWERVARAAFNGHFMFSRDYMEYHADRFTDASMLVYKGDRAVAILPANVLQGTLFSHGGLTFGGLAHVPDLGATDVARIFDAILAHCREMGLERMVYKPSPGMYHKTACETDLYFLHALGARISRRDISSTIDLRFGPPRAKARDQLIQRAKDNGVKIGRANDFSPLWNLLERNLHDRHGASPTHTLPEIDLLATRFPNHIRLFEARLDDQLLAGAVIYDNKPTAHTQYLAKDYQDPASGALDLLIAKMVDSFRQTHRHFDFGTSMQAGGGYNEGLVRFKEGFGARTTTYDQYELSF